MPRLPKTDILLVVALVLLGLYGGIGFFTLIGLNPALLKMSERTFAETWQHIDFYMGARMPFIGPVILVMTIFSTIVLYKRYALLSAVFMIIALSILVADVIIALTFNDPLNSIIQEWNLQRLPADVSVIQSRVVNAFWFRSICMIASFIFGILAFWTRMLIPHEKNAI